MADPEQRERESRESDETKFHERQGEDAERRDEVAERIVDEGPLEPREDDDR